MANLRVEPFRINVPQAELDDLQARVAATRWPLPSPGEPWAQGADLEYMRELAGYWTNSFDWREQESRLNSFAQFTADLDGVRVHFAHEKARDGKGIPIILTHGWPSTFADFLDLVPLLTDPTAHGIQGPSFDVVIPSLPGYLFSTRPARTGVTTRYTAKLWHELMTGLGYDRFGAHGGDFGASVSTYLALDFPSSLIGLHLATIDDSPFLGEGSAPLSDAERVFLNQRAAWKADDRGYGAIQSTRPQTLGYALNDSPVGLAAWLLEKWRSWSDSSGDLESTFSNDFLLTIVSLYWHSRSITTSLRDYVDNRDNAFGATDFVSVPTAIAVFRQFLDDGVPPLEWAKRMYAVRRWTPMPAGGHFAAAEQPELLAGDIRAFFGDLAATIRA